MNPYYTDYSEYLNRIFPGRKIQKISVNAGFSCPNRNGEIGTGGCIYCNNESFSPAYCHAGLDIEQQIDAGKEFFARKYPHMQYLVYFQNYTNTYAPGMAQSDFEGLYRRALDTDGVRGIVIGTRPDTVSPGFLRMLSSLGAPVFMEFGAESTHDKTLELINRHHTWGQTAEAVERTKDAGLECGLHFIAGLPGESHDMVLESVEKACRLPIDSLKMHHLQVIKGSLLQQMIDRGEMQVPAYSMEEFLDLCAGIVKVVPKKVAIERFLAQSPPSMVVSPKWGLKNYQFTDMLLKRLALERH